MKGLRGYHLGTMLCCSVFFSIVLTKFYYSVSRVNQVTCSFDRVISESLETELRDYVLKRVTWYGIDLKACTDKCLSHSLIKEISLRRSAPDRLNVVIHTHAPLMMINTHLILLANGMFVDRSCVDNNYYQSLYHMNIHGIGTTDHITENLCVWIKRMVPEIFEQYNVTWHDQTKIFLHNKNDSTLTVLCNDHTIPDNALLALCKTLKDDVQTHMNKKRELTWIADIRFKNHIVLYSMKGRGDHEEHELFG